MSEERSYLAADLGAGSGRVVRGKFGDELTLDVLHRFETESYHADGHDRWRARALFAGIECGLRAAGPSVRSIGVDTWGVDYALVDPDGELVEDPVCYRDRRTDGAVEAVLDIVPKDELFARTGLQVQPFNTIYQLFAQCRAGEWPARAATLLLMPDLMHSWLCGARTTERTNASTTQLFGATTGTWDTELMERLGLPVAVMPEIVEPGTRIGTVREELADGCAVVAPATHDTGSAVAGAPLFEGHAFLSSGTWSLLGIETAAPVLDPEVSRQNLTNEGGVEGRNRLLKNIMGLWILESCRKQWQERGEVLDYQELLARVASVPALRAVIDPDDARFFRPDDMIGAVREFLAETGQESELDQVALSRVVLESLALRYAATVDGLERVTGRTVRAVRIIGGGSQNEFLNQATANATGREVFAGPVEATALGNLIVQAIADGRFRDLVEAREYVRERLPVRRYVPRDGEAWREGRERFAEVAG